MTRADRRIRAAVFDLDDTLFRERDYVRGGYAAVAAHLAGFDAALAGRMAAWMWRQFEAGRRGDVFDRLGEAFDLGLTPERVAALVEVYRRHEPSIRPCRGVPELLGRLREAGLRLGLLSDGYLPAQELKLAATGLEGCFDEVVFTERLGRESWKPSPRGFELIRRRLSVPHVDCCYVADNPAKDFLAPNRLGWLTVQWRRPGQVHADSPAPEHGRPQRVIRTGPRLLGLLGL